MENATSKELLSATDSRPTRAFDKPANTGAPVHELLRHRWSPRSFSDRAISDEDLKTILEAGRWAASSYNEQPWRIIVARRSDKEAFAHLLSLLVPPNQTWAKKAAVLMITVAKTHFSRDNSPNYYDLHDTGQAMANMMLEATALGLQGHGMGGFDHDRAKVELHLPEGFVPGAAFALGYPAPADQLEVDWQRQSEMAPRERKPLSEIAFLGDWNQPLTLNGASK